MSWCYNAYYSVQHCQTTIQSSIECSFDGYITRTDSYSFHSGNLSPATILGSHYPLPKNKITKQIMGGLEIPLLCALVHFFIVLSSIIVGGSAATAPIAEFNQVFDPTGDPQAAFFHMTSSYPNFVAEEWSHVLTWDLFVGRYIWMDGIKRDIFTAPAVLFCNLIGPPALLIHWLTCTLTGKPILDPSIKQDVLNLEED